MPEQPALPSAWLSVLLRSSGNTAARNNQHKAFTTECCKGPLQFNLDEDVTMKKMISVTPFIGFLTLLSSTAHATTPQVPEIDGGMAAIAIGLTVGIVAVVREYRRKK